MILNFVHNRRNLGLEEKPRARRYYPRRAGRPRHRIRRGALLVPDVGEVVLLNNLLAGGSLENWTLKLFKTNVTPAESDTAASYTVADFTGYSNVTLTRTQTGATWSTASTSTGTTSSSYGSAAQSWTCSGGSAQTIYGYYVIGATSTTLLFAEAFAAARTLNPSADVLNLTPSIQLA